MGFVELAATQGARLVSMGAVALALSACSMGNMFAPASGGPSAMATANPTQQELATASTNALPAIATECPPIKVRLGGEALFYYGKGKVGDAKSLNYQAVIEKQSRNCVVSNGLITVKMSVFRQIKRQPRERVYQLQITTKSYNPDNWHDEAHEHFGRPRQPVPAWTTWRSFQDVLDYFCRTTNIVFRPPLEDPERLRLTP